MLTLVEGCGNIVHGPSFSPGLDYLQPKRHPVGATERWAAAAPSLVPTRYGGVRSVHLGHHSLLSL